MKRLLYYRIYTPHLEQILNDGFIQANSYANCICLTRSSTYLSTTRPSYIIFDADKLRQRYSIKPICIYGWSLLNRNMGKDKERYIRSLRRESEERVYTDKLFLHESEYIIIRN